MQEHLIELQEGEEILTTFRRHPIVLVKDIITMAVLFVVVISILSLAPSSIQSYTTFFGSLLLLALYTRSFVIWFKYYFDVWIVTNMRVVDIEQISLFNRKSSTVDPEHIEDITIHVNGFLQSMFGFGDLSIQTAGRVQEFLMHSIKNPDQAKAALYEAMQISKSEDHRRFAEHISNAYDPRIDGTTPTEIEQYEKQEENRSPFFSEEINIPTGESYNKNEERTVVRTPWDV